MDASLARINAVLSDYRNKTLRKRQERGEKRIRNSSRRVKRAIRKILSYPLLYLRPIGRGEFEVAYRYEYQGTTHLAVGVCWLRKIGGTVDVGFSSAALVTGD